MKKLNQPLNHVNDLLPQGKLRIAQSRGLKKLLLSIIPYHVYLIFRQEIHLVWLKFRHKLIGSKIKVEGNHLVNLGCGSSGKLGWINVDMFVGDNINLICDIRKKILLPDGCAKGIFCEHFLEHLDYSEEVPFFLSECYRILQVDGVIRIVVPDAGKYLHAYCLESWDELKSIRPLDSEHRDRWFGNQYQTRMELINQVFRQGVEHKFAYDNETLQVTLEKFGFSQIMSCQYGQGSMPELCIDKESRRSESLYIEAIKQE